MQRLIYLSILLSIVICWSCQQYKENPTEPNSTREMGRASISFVEIPSEVTSVLATLSRPNFEGRSLFLSISDSERTAYGEFENVPIGMWHLTVEARDNRGIVRYFGETDVDVRSDETAVVELVLHATTGNIEIHVSWGKKCVQPPSGLISWWTGDGTANDKMGTNHGTLMNGASYFDGKVGRAFSLDGVDDYVRISHSPDLNPSGSFTICAWVYPTNDVTGNIISKWGDQDLWWNQRSFLVELRPNGVIRFALSDAANQLNSDFHILETENGVIALNEWNHIAAVFQQEEGRRLIYLNGKKIAQRVDAPFYVFQSSADVSIGVVKRSPINFFPQTFFPGLIDEVCIFNRELRKNEIKKIYKAGRFGKCK